MLLAAAQASLALLRAGPSAWRDGALWVEVTELGVVTVTSHIPGAREPQLADHAHLVAAMSVGADGVPVLLLKQAKRDAERMVVALHRVDSVSFTHLNGHRYAVDAWAGEGSLGRLTTVTIHPGEHAVWSREREGELWVCAGGAKRRTYRASDILARLSVRLRPE